MKIIFTLLTGVASVSAALFAVNKDSQSFSKPSYMPKHLFPVPIDNRIAFIDSTGSLFIPPIYESADEFSEGLCAVRANGLYGFIDLHGNTVIKPAYDYATLFHEGHALVYLKNKPCFINRHGVLVIKPHYTAMTRLYSGRSYVWTSTYKTGVIDSTGKLVVDTIYSQINRFKEGFTIASVTKHGDEDMEYQEEVIIDSLGNKITNAGQYENISGPYEGYFIAAVPNKEEYYSYVLLDRAGKIIRHLDKRDHAYGARIENGIIKLSRNKRPKDVNSGTYEFYTTVTGKPIYVKREIWSGNNFSGNFAFCRNKKRDFVLINRNGKEIGYYDDLQGNGFSHGKALVKKDGTWGVIDTTGAFITKTNFEKLHDAGMVGDYFYFEEPGYDYKSRREAKYGIADKKGNVIVQPSFQYFDHNGFVNGLLKTWIDYRVTYFNTEGKFVWQQANQSTIHAMNIDYMQRCYFSVSHANTGHPSRYGVGPEEITSKHTFTPQQVSVTVAPDDTVHLDNTFVGMKVFVANTTTDTIVFNAQDGVLYMTTQALGEDGKWKDIDFMPHSWCGNSYHSVALMGNHYWPLEMPRYEGSFQTKLRLELTYVNPSDTTSDYLSKSYKLDGRSRRQANSIKVYSNIFDGSVNPGQFWRKVVHQSQGIMDPYDE